MNDKNLSTNSNQGINVVENSGNISQYTGNNIFLSQTGPYLMPDELEEFLTFLSDESFSDESPLPFTKPDLQEKNKLNGINDNYYKDIEDDFIYFQEIENIFRKNSSKELEQKYKNALRILRLDYNANYNNDIKKFFYDIVAKYKTKKNCNTQTSLKLLRLLHFMYSQCDIGNKP